MKTLILCCLLISACTGTQAPVSLAGSPSPAASATGTTDLQDWPKAGLPATQPLPANAMKGYELYSAVAKSGDWHYFLLPGTNRMKTAEEILAAGSTVGTDAIRAKLAALPKDSSVFWINGSTALHLTGKLPGIGLPGNDVTATLQAATRTAGVVLVID